MLQTQSGNSFRCCMLQQWSLPGKFQLDAKAFVISLLVDDLKMLRKLPRLYSGMIGPALR
jgi:hypothetical protein